jgi:hypothetical protein
MNEDECLRTPADYPCGGARQDSNLQPDRYERAHLGGEIQ